MDSVTYQLVSKHSILSAQRKNRVAVMEEILEKEATHSKSEWKEQIDKIKRQLVRRGRRSDELSEKDFEIYLEMKLLWLQQFYVSANLRKPKKRRGTAESEKEEEGWNEAQVNLKFQNVNVVANHQNYKNREGENGGGHGDKIGGDLDPPWKPMTIEAQREGELPEEPAPETPNEDAVVAEASQLNALREISCVTHVCDKEKKEERSRRRDEKVETLDDDNDWGRPSEEEDDGVTVRMWETVCDREVFLSLCNVKRDGFGKEEEANVGWISKKVNLMSNPLGQAHH